MDTVIINGSNQFWSGRRWVGEYPDAAVLTHKAAVSVAAKLAEHCGTVTVIDGYGSNSAHYQDVDKNGEVLAEAWAS